MNNQNNKGMEEAYEKFLKEYYNDGEPTGLDLFYGGAQWVKQQGDGDRWVPVSDRLPEESFYYHTWVKGFSRPVELYFDIQDRHFRTTDRSIIHITHWQPLPPPPTK